jgi:hypothetical protein
MKIPLKSGQHLGTPYYTTGGLHAAIEKFFLSLPNLPPLLGENFQVPLSCDRKPATWRFGLAVGPPSLLVTNQACQA